LQYSARVRSFFAVKLQSNFIGVLSLHKGCFRSPASLERSAARTRSNLMARSRKSSKKKSSPPGQKRWSGRVTRESHALVLQDNVFTKPSAVAIARSLKRSAQQSTQRKSSPYRSALSMLTFYINRAGKKLPARRRAVLERAKYQLRKLFNR
jgi:hypothetical protein